MSHIVLLRLSGPLFLKFPGAVPDALVLCSLSLFLCTARTQIQFYMRGPSGTGLARILAPGMHVPVMAAVCCHERALSCALYRLAHGCTLAAAC
eukprot:1152358-Pelagomonas_calceolata.AAC.1